MLPSLSSVSHLLCLWEESDSWGACPSFAITKRKGQSHTHPGHTALQAAPGGPQCGEGGRAGALLTLPAPPLPGTEEALSGEGAEGLSAPGPPNAA